MGKYQVIKKMKDEFEKTIVKMVQENDFSIYYKMLDDAIYNLVTDRLNYKEGEEINQKEIICELNSVNVRHLINDIYGLQKLKNQLREFENYAVMLNRKER